VNKEALCKGVSMCEGIMLDREVPMCLDLVLEGGSSAQCTNIMYGARLDYVA
jgi:hypothetical protein